MAHDPISGPIPREQFRELISAPYGQAVKTIRKYDPQFGRADGEKYRWRVRAEGTMIGTAYVLAASQKEAEQAAADLDCGSFDWDDARDGFDVISVEPRE